MKLDYSVIVYYRSGFIIIKQCSKMEPFKFDEKHTVKHIWVTFVTYCKENSLSYSSTIRVEEKCKVNNKNVIVFSIYTVKSFFTILNIRAIHFKQ